MTRDYGLLKDFEMCSAISVHNCQRDYCLSLSKASLQSAQIQKVQSTPESDIVEDVAGF